MRRSDISTEGQTGAKALQLPQISPDTICNVQWLETSGVWILHRHRHCVMIWKKNCIYCNNSHVKVMECEDRDSGNWVCDTTNCRQMSCESTTYSMCWASLLGPLSKVLHVQLWCQHPWQRIYFEAAERPTFSAHSLSKITNRDIPLKVDVDGSNWELCGSDIKQSLLWNGTAHILHWYWSWQD